jgi:uncharacterized membrane protein YdjX (TVP38/TMEM64 family)
VYVRRIIPVDLHATNRMTPKQRLTLARVLAFIAVIAISVYVYSIRDQASELSKYGFPGIFILSILANGTVLLPAPAIVLVFAWGSVFNPLGVGLAAGGGAALGELTGYLAGFSGQAVVEHADLYNRLVDWMQNNQRISYLIILILAFIPNPFFDLAGMAAGTLKMPLSRFLLWCFIGKTLKMLLFAYLGAEAITLFH